MLPLFPYFGGKRRAAPTIWAALGHVDRYIEPFFGSGAVLLANPNAAKSELVNDVDHHLANLWRSLQRDRETVWRVASAPCAEIELQSRLRALASWQPPDLNDLEACDPFAAGLWLHTASAAIKPGDRALNRADHGKGVKALDFSRTWYDLVCDRISRVQVLCGDWSRCVTPAALVLGERQCQAVGVFLDPPYGTGRDVAYESGTSDVAEAVWRWAVENGHNPRLRIVVAGYEDGRIVPPDWRTIKRIEHGGLGNVAGNANRYRESLWVSPSCVAAQASLFSPGEV